MSLLRPSCAALARRLCTPPPLIESASRSHILGLLHTCREPWPWLPLRSQRRSLCHTPCHRANVIDTPHTATHKPEHRKRTVRIGPLPRGPVKDTAIQRIFKGKLTAAEGNNVLRILHHRRTTGSLADYGVENLGQQYTHVGKDLALNGLKWLRDHYPIDEARAAAEWAEKEANRIAYELWLADPETESKYKDPARAFKENMEKEEQARLQQESEVQKMGILHTGKSQFERNIEEKRRQRLEEITRIAEEKEKRERDMEAKLATGEWVRTPSGTQLMKPGQTAYVDIFGREQVSRRKENMEQYSVQAQLTDAVHPDDLLERTTMAQRLYPMTAFVFFTIVLCIAAAHFYVPPSPSYRIFPDLPLSTTTIAGIVAINAVITMSWRFLPLWPLLTRYFMNVPAYPRAVQSLLNCFSHVQYEHLLSNMMMLCLVGPACCELVGRGTFMSTYISAGVFGSVVSLYWANLGKGCITAHSVGASGAIWGIGALYCLLTDRERLTIPFLKDHEVAFWPKMLFAAFVVMELISARKGTRKGNKAMDHASHYGGMAVGIATAGYLRATGFYEKRASAEAEAERKRKMVDAEGMT